ncbi:MAG: endonuclease/exonuclease/phosphatase family protein [Aeromicrobium sp.]
MRPRRRGLAAILVAICVSFAALAVPAAAGAAPPGRGQHSPAAVVDVASYNLYLGADLAPLFGASSFPDLVSRAGQVYAAMEATKFPERAKALAKVIAKERPDLIGLQEVALWETAPGTVQGPTATFATTYDFQKILLAELAKRGVRYSEVATNTNFTGTLPIALGGSAPGFPSSTWARFTDHDVILARDGKSARDVVVNPSSVDERNFTAKLSLPSFPGGPAFDVPRGWSSVDVTAKKSTFRFFNTHLEAFGGGSVRNPQATELAGVIESSPHPAIVVGDINSSTPGCLGDNDAFQILLDTGLSEVWPAVHRRDRCGGVTSGQDADLLNSQSALDQRIDVVMFDPDGFKALRAKVIGDERRDRSWPTGLWPSDHAGSVATLRTARR